MTLTEAVEEAEDADPEEPGDPDPEPEWYPYSVSSAINNESD